MNKHEISGFLSQFTEREKRDLVVPLLWEIFRGLERDAAIRHATIFIEQNFVPAKKPFVDSLGRIKADVEHVQPKFYLSVEGLSIGFQRLGYKVEGEKVYAKKRPKSLSRVRSKSGRTRLPSRPM